MHVNNEIGNVLDLSRVGKLCHENDALFHTDAVQGIAHFTFDLEQLPVDFSPQLRINFMDQKELVFFCKKKLWPSTFYSWWVSRARIASRNRISSQYSGNAKST